jgi:Flp pilus assembly protein TadD
LPWLEKAVQLAPENPALHSELGALFARLGNAAESRRHLDEARRLKAAEEKTPRS